MQNTKLISQKFDLITDKSYENVFNYTKFKVLTRILNALSLTFVVGERFFCDSVRLHEDEVDQDLQNEIKVFIRQEAQHSLAHRSLNNILKEYGANVPELEKLALYKLHSLGVVAEEKLLTTKALEDLTALGGWLYIPFAFLFKDCQTSNLWKLHAKEERAHHFVAKDTYDQVYGKNFGSTLKYLLHFGKTSVKLIEQIAYNYKHLKQIETKVSNF